MCLTHLHDRPDDLPFPARTAQGHAMMIRRWIATTKVWMRANPGRTARSIGRDRLRELVGIFREDCAGIDRAMERREDARSLINFSIAAE